MTETASGAAIARQTTKLVRAYCRTLEITPADLPALIAYVGAVLSRAAASPIAAAPRARRKRQHAAPLPQPIAQIVSLEQFRAARSGRIAM